jgi:hypothetical protein
LMISLGTDKDEENPTLVRSSRVSSAPPGT